MTTAPSRQTYAAGPTTEVEVPVDAPPALVWELGTDINLPPEEFLGAEWLDGATGPAVGARFAGSNTREGPALDGAEHDRGVRGGARLAWDVGDPAEPSAGGATH